MSDVIVPAAKARQCLDYLFSLRVNAETREVDEDDRIDVLARDLELAMIFCLIDALGGDPHPEIPK